MISYTCPKCGNRMSSPYSLAGQPERCTACGKVTEVPQFTADVPVPPARSFDLSPDEQELSTASLEKLARKQMSEKDIRTPAGKRRRLLALMICAGLCVVLGLALTAILEVSGTVQPKPGKYGWTETFGHWRFGHVKLSLSFTVTDDRQIIHAIASESYPNEGRISLATGRATPIRRSGRFRLSGYSFGEHKKLVFYGKFVTPTRVEGTWTCDGKTEKGTWSAVHPSEKHDKAVKRPVTPPKPKPATKPVTQPAPTTKVSRAD